MADSKNSADFFDCSLCKTFTHSKRDAEAHLRGKPHRDMLARLESAQRSVYVRGFSGKAKEADIKGVFDQFGVVKHVGLALQMGFAIVEFADVDSALRALRHPEELVLLGKKLVVRERKVGGSKRPKHKVKQSTATKEEAMEVVQAETTPSDSSRIGGVRFSKDTLDLIQATSSIDEEVKILATHCSMSAESVKTQFSISHSLSNQLESIFPGCLVLPFGAPISGHGTVTSDCDICLLIDPTEQDKKILKGEAFYSSAHMAMWKSISSENDDPTEDKEMSTPFEQVKQFSPPPLPSPSSFSELDASTSDDSNTSAASTPSGLTPQQATPRKKKKTSVHFDMLVSFLRSKEEYDRIIPIEHARCPIIRFIHRPSALHCDLSINNRLGPYNTRLMQAYFDFDPRMAHLIPVVRLWARSMMRTQLSSYAISLLLIFSLQHTTPPVLPCLQDPGPWPRDMEWYIGKGFAGTTRDVGDSQLTVNGWECGFTHPLSLKPSTNTSTPVELLAHFLKFYSELFNFGQQVVAVHSRSSLTLEQANTLLQQSCTSRSSQSRLPLRIYSPMCIQDPFDLSHNVTKSIRKPAYSALCENLKLASAILDKQIQLGSSSGSGGTERGSLLSIFDKDHYCKMVAELTDPNTLVSKSIPFSSATIAKLLAREASLQVLAEGLCDLDLTNEGIVEKLGVVVVLMLVKILRDVLGFVCTENSIASVEDTPLKEGTASEAVVMASDPTKQVEDSPLASSENETSRKRQRTEEQLELQDPDEEEEEHVKRSKVLTSLQPSALDVLTSAAVATGSDSSSTWLCSGTTNTWVHRRRARRQEKVAMKTSAEEAGVSSLANSLPSVVPVLQFKLALRACCDSHSHGNILSVELTPTDVQYAAKFVQFVAYFRKYVRHADV